MKTWVLCAISVLFAVNSVSAQTPQSLASPTPSPAPAPATPVPATPAPVVSAPMPRAPSQAPTPLISLAPPVDVASLNAKEILTANNAVVSQVATMYQWFAGFITLLVAFVGGLATWLGFQARKNVQEFVAEWKEKLLDKEKLIDAAIKRAQEAEAATNKNVAEAAKHADELKTGIVVLNKTLSDADLLKNQMDALKESVAALTSEVRMPGVLPGGVAPVATPATPAPTPVVSPSVTEPISTNEEASVAERLKGRLPPAPPTTPP